MRRYHYYDDSTWRNVRSSHDLHAEAGIIRALASAPGTPPSRHAYPLAA